MFKFLLSEGKKSHEYLRTTRIPKPISPMFLKPRPLLATLGIAKKLLYISSIGYMGVRLIKTCQEIDFS